MNLKNRKRRALLGRWLLLVGCLSAALMLAGCGRSSTTNKMTQKPSKIQILGMDENTHVVHIASYIEKEPEAEVRVAVWSKKTPESDGQNAAEGNQDDLFWYRARKKAGLWQVDVHLENHNLDTGYYFIHAYIGDKYYADGFFVVPETPEQQVSKAAQEHNWRM